MGSPYYFYSGEKYHEFFSSLIDGMDAHSVPDASIKNIDITQSNAAETRNSNGAANTSGDLSDPTLKMYLGAEDLYLLINLCTRKTEKRSSLE